ncbi:DUF433 domain-containing protein [Pseudomonas sp. R5(2019)]|uniref:DUF433 domain-containing protein n=1 Tax=Pseudomonas sp. R5(2019) TaxID=2697566 RepID=UPI001412D30E|nr:DUF433 domain-containing protein [Pseudomonas sp. R5(2019)]NBA95976.1 DUF433 domain-containing protein [Pseudomonas sp. R5(2019)]
MTATAFARSVSSEVAFVTQTSESEVDRLLDDGLLPGRFVTRTTRREYDLLGTAVSVCINHKFKNMLSRAVRRDAIDTWAACYYDAAAKEIARKSAIDPLAEWLLALSTVDLGPLTVNIRDEMLFVILRMQQLSKAYETVVCDPDILGGEPVFKGSRLPIENILATVGEGVPLELIQEDYPFLTEEMIDLARLYRETHPRRGRPRKAGPPKGWKLVESKNVRAARGEE